MKVVIDISKLPCKSKNGKSCMDCHFYTGDLCEVPAQLEKFPTIDRPQGEWKNAPYGYYFGIHKCSNCGFYGNQLWHFCPNCGALMKKEGEQK